MGDQARRKRALLGLMVRPTLAGVLAGAVWYLVFFLPKRMMAEVDESAFTDAGINGQVAFHAIIAGFAIYTVWQRRERVVGCADRGDETEFGRCVREGIPGEIHIFLGSLAFLILSMTLRLNFIEEVNGIHLNFAIAYTLTLFWEAAINLTDPKRPGSWFEGRIPPEWLEKARNGGYNKLAT